MHHCCTRAPPLLRSPPGGVARISKSVAVPSTSKAAERRFRRFAAPRASEFKLNCIVWPSGRRGPREARRFGGRIERVRGPRRSGGMSARQPGPGLVGVAVPLRCARGRAGVPPGVEGAEGAAVGGREALSLCRVLIGNFVLERRESDVRTRVPREIGTGRE